MPSVHLAKNIQFLRKQRKISQQALANALGLSRSNIASYENAKAEPRAEVLLQIGQYFQIQLEDLIGRSLQDQIPESPKAITDQRLSPDLEEPFREFAQESARFRKILEGLRAYHELEQSRPPQDRQGMEVLLRNYEYLLNIMDRLVLHQEQMLREM